MPPKLNEAAASAPVSERIASKAVVDESIVPPVPSDAEAKKPGTIVNEAVPAKRKQSKIRLESDSESEDEPLVCPSRTWFRF